MKPIRFILILFLLGCSMSCDKDHLLDCTKGTGPYITVTRYIQGFNKIYLSDNVDLKIIAGKNWDVKVTAGQLLIDGIITELQGDKLYIRNENRCNWVRSFSNTYTVEISVPEVEYVNYNGSGNITCEDSITYNGFTFDCWNGSGNIELKLKTSTSHLNIHLGRCTIKASGNSGVSYVYLNDVGVVDAAILSSGYTFIRNSSTGAASVNASTELTAEILHTGNISYYGNPVTINQSISGSGKLIKK